MAFGQYPVGVIPHPRWGSSPATCFTNTTPGTGGDPIIFPESVTGLVRTGEDDNRINSFADRVQDNFNSQNYDELPQETKQVLQSKADDVTSQLNALHAKGDSVKAEWSAYGNVVARRQGDPRSPEVANAFTNAQAGLMELSNQKRASFTDIDMLMVYAPDGRTSRRLCIEKLKAERSLARTIDTVQEMNRSISGQISEFLANRDSWLATIENMLKLFLAAIQTLINIILGAFKLAPKVLVWFYEHPKISITLGIFVGLSILGFLLRPYVAVFQAIT